jgi:hypothetical protein
MYIRTYIFRWDEWVPKARLRWAVDKNEIAHIQSDDIVELWCCGANVPGAWLESKGTCFLGFFVLSFIITVFIFSAYAFPAGLCFLCAFIATLL